MPCGAPKTARPVSPCVPTSNRSACSVWAGDANGCSAVVAVAINVAHVNHPPFAAMVKPHACENEENTLCVSGTDNDGDALPTAFIQALPANGKMYALSTQNPAARTEITPAMLPFAIGASSNINGSTSVIGCVAYMPPADAYGLQLDSFSYTVDDGQALNHESPVRLAAAACTRRDDLPPTAAAAAHAPATCPPRSRSSCPSTCTSCTSRRPSCPQR